MFRSAYFLSLFLSLSLTPASVEAESKSTPASVRIPAVEFVDTPMGDAVNFIAHRIKELGPNEPETGKINFVLLGGLEDETLTFQLYDVPALEILKVMAELVDAKLHLLPEVAVICRGELGDAVFRDTGSDALEAKLRAIQVPQIEFQDTPLQDALDFLKTDSVSGKSSRVNLVLKKSEPVHVTLSLESVSLFTALEMTVRAAGHQMIIREHLVFVAPGAP